MSGGFFNHQQYQFALIADEIQQLVDTNDSEETNRWGDTVGRGYEPATIAEFRMGIAYLRLAAIYTQRIDYLVSGDDGEESFHRRLQQELQADLGTKEVSLPK
jgi:hypothetical protein